ncbi:MAG: IS30 family transposase [Kiritimatiellae bacterium]|nr:IS30 family transposase [Kiritimatiellia bacterium]
MRYRHLTMYEREVIEVVLRKGGTIVEASKAIGRSAATVSREVKRNGSAGRYEASSAHRRASNRLRAWRRPRRFDAEGVREYVGAKLQEHYSPEQIVGSWTSPLARVSVQTIYTYIHRERPEWLIYLRQTRSRLRRKGYRQPRKYRRIRGIKSIDQRPEVVDQRGRVGDWESDTIRGSDRHAGIATHVDRRTGYVVLAKLKDRSARVYNRATLAAFRRHGQNLPTHTFTVDHGMEFARFSAWERASAAEVFFAAPYCAWQRGCNENLNGLLRQYFPKDRDFRTITTVELQRVEARLNARPRKRLGYQSPIVLMKQFLALVP